MVAYLAWDQEALVRFQVRGKVYEYRIIPH